MRTFKRCVGSNGHAVKFEHCRLGLLESLLDARGYVHVIPYGQPAHVREWRHRRVERRRVYVVIGCWGRWGAWQPHWCYAHSSGCRWKDLLPEAEYR